MDHQSEHHHGSTISFSVLCSNFSNLSTDVPSHTFVRTFNRVSDNQSQFGTWRCILEETKRQYHSDIELHLSLGWILTSCSSLSTEDGTSTTYNSQSQEFVRQIKTIKVFSDSTLSELLIKQLDGYSLLRGEFIKVGMQPNRVSMNGRYMFRICFYTQDITQGRIIDTPIVTPYLDLDGNFDPMEYNKEPPDIAFRFLPSKVVRDETMILAHSSMLGESLYFTRNVNEAREEKARKGEPYNGLTCLIGEFSPTVFRTMLRYLYLGKLGLKNRSIEAERKVIASITLDGAKPKDKGSQSNRVCSQQTPHYEDLYRISERYEIPSLKAISLKAMRCSLDMSIAIVMLANLPGELHEAARGRVGVDEKEREFNKMQIESVLDVVKEYMYCFGIEASRPRRTMQDARVQLSVDDRVELIQYIGDCVLNNISRFWERPSANKV